VCGMLKLTHYIPFSRCAALFREVHFSTIRTSGYHKTDCIRENCDVYSSTSRIDRGVRPFLFLRISNMSWHILLRLSTYFLCHKFIDMFIRTFIHTFIHTFIRTFIHMFIHTFVRTYKLIYNTYIL